MIRNEFQDRINKKKYMNARFLKLNPNMKIVIQSNTSSASSHKAQAQKDQGNILNKEQIKQIEIAEKKASTKSFSELFVCMMGETGSNSLTFFNVNDFLMVKQLDLIQESCVHMTSHCKNHLSIIMATASGSMFLWSTRPAKIMQTLAPFFTEVDENIEYVEREDEFEKHEEDGSTLQMPAYCKKSAENKEQWNSLASN
jgi:hypothetical protein